MLTKFEDTEDGVRLIAEEANAQRRLREAEHAKRFDPELEAARERLQQAKNKLRNLPAAPLSHEHLMATVATRERAVADARAELGGAPRGSDRHEHARRSLERAETCLAETQTWRFDPTAQAEYYRLRDALVREVGQLEGDLSKAETGAGERIRQQRERSRLWDLLGKNPDDELSGLREAAALAHRELIAARKAHAEQLRPQLDELRQLEAGRMRAAFSEAQSAGKRVREIECQMRSHGILVEGSLVPLEISQAGSADALAAQAAVHAHYQPIMRDARQLIDRVIPFLAGRR